jgi:hypothetical protein
MTDDNAELAATGMDALRLIEARLRSMESGTSILDDMDFAVKLYGRDGKITNALAFAGFCANIAAQALSHYQPEDRQRFLDDQRARLLGGLDQLDDEDQE